MRAWSTSRLAKEASAPPSTPCSFGRRRVDRRAARSRPRIRRRLDRRSMWTSETVISPVEPATLPERHHAVPLHRVDKPASQHPDVSIFVPELPIEAERLRVATADHRVQLHGPACPQPGLGLLHHCRPSPRPRVRALHGEVVHLAAVAVMADHHGGRQLAGLDAPSTDDIGPRSARSKSRAGSFHGRVRPASSHRSVAASRSAGVSSPMSIPWSLLHPTTDCPAIAGARRG